MNWVDLVIVLMLGYFIIEGWGRRFIGECLDFLSFGLALILSLKFYNGAANFLQHSFQLAHSLSNALGFFLVWALVEIALALLAHLLLSKTTFLQLVDNKLRSLSFIPAFIRGLILVAVLLVL